MYLIQRCLYILGLSLLFPCLLSAQFNVKITVTGGQANTTCTDAIGAPDPAWSVNIAGEGWTTYPALGPCYTSFPNVQYDHTFLCAPEVPATVQVCLRIFENDASIFDPCTPVTSCLAQTCMDVTVPPFGSVPVVIEMPDGQGSDGQINLTISTSGVPGGLNDPICSAFDIGVLPNQSTVGDADTSLFNNFCATSLGDPNPQDYGQGWANNQGVWFRFTTGPDPGTHIVVEAQSDPSSFGDPINLQVAVFGAENDACTGPYTLLAENHDPVDFDEKVVFTCPEPNTTYFVLVDGVQIPNNPEELEGYFGIQITELGVAEAAEFRCSAEDLGIVPAGGSVSTPGPRTNACSGNANAAAAAAFGVQRSVWFRFTPPPTGHVFLTGISDTADDPLGIQLAVYRSASGLCSGTMMEVYSQHTANDLDETLELHCLDPEQTYFILVDGAPLDLNAGIFTLSITDAGDETPRTDLTEIICAGESFSVGSSTYTQSGIYHDTITLPGGCDSIVNTSLTVLAPIVVNAGIVQQGVGAGNNQGIAAVTPGGGSGPYTAQWSNGQAGLQVSGLLGGENYCVTVTDTEGCMADTCFEMPYFIHFVPTLTVDSVNCFGEANGAINFTVNGGQSPYLYTWQNGAGTQTGSGQILNDGLPAVLPGLPAGTYSISISDVIFDTTLLVTVLQPSALSIMQVNNISTSCFGICDGSLEVTPAGGTPPYTGLWSNGSTGFSLQDLCSGDYSLTLTDANGCTHIVNYTVHQPDEFILTASQLQPVSCYQFSDGSAIVSTNGNAASYEWSNGGNAAIITGVSGGVYSVTVTNTDGCSAVASVMVETPEFPLSLEILQEREVECNGDSMAQLSVIPEGPGNTFTFNWNTGSQLSTLSSIGAGIYTVTITNENGCTATGLYSVTEPDEIFTTDITNEITCLDPADAGVVTITAISGGIPPYTYSSDGFLYNKDTILTGYSSGLQSYFVQDAGGCIREFNVTIPGPAPLLADLPDDRTLLLGETLELHVTSNQDSLTYNWTPATGLSCQDCANPTAQPIEDQLYTVIITDSFGCTATASIQLDVRRVRRVFVPNAFSPNGDGFNDGLTPFAGPDVVQILEFKIFDRQGNMVHSVQNLQANDLAQAWDGSFRGKAMQSGVFVWMAKVLFLDGETEVLRGDVVLLK